MSPLRMPSERKTGRNFLGGRLVLVPGVGQVLPFAVLVCEGLPKGRSVAKLCRGFLEDLINGARLHSANMLSDGGGGWWKA